MAERGVARRGAAEAPRATKKLNIAFSSPAKIAREKLK